MKTIAEKAEQFLLSNTVWIYLTVITLYSALWIMTFIAEQSSLIYLSGRKWLEFLSFTAANIFVFLPLLLFTAFRSTIKRKVSALIYPFLWAYCFLIHPLIIGWLDWQNLFFPVSIDGIIICTLTFIFLLIEGILAVPDWIYHALFDRKSIDIGKSSLFSLFLMIYIIIIVRPNNDHDSLLITLLNSGFFFLIYFYFYHINHYFLIRKIYKEKGLVHYFFSFILLLLVTYPILVLSAHYLPIFSNQVIELSGDYWVPQSEAPAQFKAMDGTQSLLIFLSFIPISIILEWYRQTNQIAVLEKEKSTTELNLLKQQINPHFFFNTLNNLYALSITKDAKTPEVIMQLSELMRYVIYKGKEETVMIKEEVKYIEDYIRLQQIRLHKSLDFRFDQQIENPRLKVPPLLFIILIENAFKHGIETAERDCFLHLELKSDQEGVIFICKNSVERKSKSKKGLGLDNLRRRLALRFPERHQLITQEKEGAYEVFLKFGFFRVS